MKRTFKTSLKDSIRRDIFVKSPSAKSQRASFSIIQRLHNADGTLQNKSLKSETLDNINNQFQTGSISFEKARMLVKDIVEQIRAQDKEALQFHSDNQELVRRYWSEEYGHRDIVDRGSALNRLKRAADAVGPYSLYSASREELQAEIDRRFKGNKQRAIVAAVNQLLKYVGRKDKLRRGREEFNRVRYLTKDELPRMLTHIADDKLRLMHEVAFATGLRAGELFGLLPDDIKDGHLQIFTQIDTDRRRRATKTRKERKAYILKSHLPAVKEWARIPLEERLRFRKRSIAVVTKRACLKAFPGQTDKHCVFHDLRHSYAIYMVSRGISLTLVSQSIGDSLKVTERYYSGFALTDDSIQLISTLLD